MSSLMSSAARIAWQRRRSTIAERTLDERPFADEPRSEDRGGTLTDTQVWHWTESVSLSGYGPGASNFL